MQTDRILTVVMVLACLITFAAPSYAGWVAIENRSSTNTYHVSAEVWGMGWTWPSLTLDAGPGCNADKSSFFGSIGMITISTMDPKTRKLTLKKTYQPPGAYLPWRNFNVKVYADKDETIKVIEQ